MFCVHNIDQSWIEYEKQVHNGRSMISNLKMHWHSLFLSLRDAEINRNRMKNEERQREKKMSDRTQTRTATTKLTFQYHMWSEKYCFIYILITFDVRAAADLPMSMSLYVVVIILVVVIVVVVVNRIDFSIRFLRCKIICSQSNTCMVCSVCAPTQLNWTDMPLPRRDKITDRPTHARLRISICVRMKTCVTLNKGKPHKHWYISVLVVFGGPICRKGKEHTEEKKTDNNRYEKLNVIFIIIISISTQYTTEKPHSKTLNINSNSSRRSRITKDGTNEFEAQYKIAKLIKCEYFTFSTFVHFVCDDDMFNASFHSWRIAPRPASVRAHMWWAAKWDRKKWGTTRTPRPLSLSLLLALALALATRQNDKSFIRYRVRMQCEKWSTSNNT